MFLAAEQHERRRRVVVIIDEAHLLAPDQLEELRLLTNAVIWTIARIVLTERCSV
jgi:type II secretory pathway predicted ATPase ExeA